MPINALGEFEGKTYFDGLIGPTVQEAEQDFLEYAKTSEHIFPAKSNPDLIN